MGPKTWHPHNDEVVVVGDAAAMVVVVSDLVSPRRAAKLADFACNDQCPMGGCW